MNAFEIYVRHLAQHLPWGGRKELVNELLSDLYAELEVVKQDSPTTEDEVLMREIIERREDPEQLASSLEQRKTALIGPRVYPIYRISLWISLSASLLLVVAVTLGFGQWHTVIDWALLGRLSLVTVMVFSIVTMVFAALDRTNFSSSFLLPTRQQKRPLPTARAIPLHVVLKGLLFPVLLLIAINLLPQYIGLPFVIFEAHHIRIQWVPVLSDVFISNSRYLVDLWCIVAVTITLFRASRQWFTRAAWLILSLRTVSVLLIAVILVSQPIFSVPIHSYLDVFPADVAVGMTDMFPFLFKALLAIFWLGLGLRVISLIRDAFWLNRMGYVAKYTTDKR